MDFSPPKESYGQTETLLIYMICGDACSLAFNHVNQIMRIIKSYKS
jgi:hypothetical protein